MTTPTGTISMTDIQTEFGGTNPIGLNEYYAGGAYVPAGTSGVPSSDTISINNLRGKSKTVPVTVTVTPSSRAEGSWFTISPSASPILYSTLYWKITDLTNLQTADFNVTSGVIYYDTEFGNTYTQDMFRPIQDSSYEGPGTFRVTVYSDDLMTQQVGQSGLLTVTDTYSTSAPTLSRTSIYRYANLNTAYMSSVVTMNTAGLEGATIYYEVYTTTAGQTLTSSDDIDAPTSLTGTLTVPAGGAVELTVRATEWNGALYIPTDKNIVVRFRMQNASGSILGTSPGITLIKTPTFGVSVSPTTIREGQSCTVAVTMLNIPLDASGAAEVYYTTTTGTWISTASLASDFVGYSSSSGSYTFTTATTSYTSFTLTAKLDTVSESDELLYITFRLKSTTGTAFWVVGDNPPSNPPITVQSPAQITTASGSISGASITNISSYPADRTFTVQFRNGSGGWNNSNVYTNSQITVPADNVSSNSIAMLNDPGGSSASHTMQYQFTNPNYATYTTTAAAETFTWPVYALVLSATGTNASGATRSIYAQITSTPIYGTARTFSIQYSLKNAGAATWGAWTNLSTVTVPLNATSSSNTLVYGPVTASAQFDLRLRCVLAGQETRESNELLNLWLG